MNTLTLDVETHGPDESATSYLVPVARIDGAFVVKRTADTVQWTTAFPVSAKTLHFEARAYAQAIEALLQSLPGLFLQAGTGGARVELVPAGCDRFVGAVDGNA